MPSLDAFAIVGFVLVVSIGWGYAPLAVWVVRLATGRDLRRVGTGNVSVAAAFYHGGRIVGTAVVGLEVVRSILAVVVAGLVAGGDGQAAAILGLVIGRALAGGAGLTSAFWAALVYLPVGTMGLTLLGAVLLTVTRSRTLASVVVFAAVPPVVWLLRQSLVETALAVPVAILLVLLPRLRHKDLDLSAAQTRSTPWIQRWFQGRRHVLDLNVAATQADAGTKARNLGIMIGAGLPVPPGVVVLPAARDRDITRGALSHGSFAVRSSALAEDADRSSAAGQYRTELDITAGQALLNAVGNVRASGSLGETIPVIVQQQIAASWSGVLFTRNPLDARAVMLVEAEPGVGGVVRGDRTPTRVSLQRDGSPPPTSPLPAGLVAELATLGPRIEAVFGATPQDIEWAWDGERTWIVQARPITTLSPVWTRRLASEFVPGAVRPLPWSINEPAICRVWAMLLGTALGRDAAGLDLERLATLHDVHAYFNASVLTRAFSLLGLPTARLSPVSRGGAGSRPDLARLAAHATGMLQLLRRERAVRRAARRDGASWIALTEAVAATDADGAAAWSLAQRLRQQHDTIVEAKVIVPIGLALARAVTKPDDGWLDAIEAPESIATGLLEALAHANQAAVDAATTLDELPPTVQTELATITARFAWLSQQGVDIAAPTWGEQPEFVFSVLRGLARTEDRPRRVATAPRGPLAHWRYRQVADRAEVNAAVAEAYARTIAALRHVLQTVESSLMERGLLATPGDVFFLRWDELAALQQNGDNAALGDLVAARKAAFRGHAERDPAPLVFGAIPFRPGPPPAAAAAGGALQGIAGSPGTAIGTVVIIRDLSLTSALPPGSVAVVPFTDAGWAPVLAQAVAIVAEAGGQLSHGAILARERGIPAVMDVTDAMRRLQPGQWVSVDGSAGTVQVMSGGPGTPVRPAPQAPASPSR